MPSSPTGQGAKQLSSHCGRKAKWHHSAWSRGSHHFPLTQQSVLSQGPHGSQTPGAPHPMEELLPLDSPAGSSGFTLEAGSPALHSASQLEHQRVTGASLNMKCLLETTCTFLRNHFTATEVKGPRCFDFQLFDIYIVCDNLLQIRNFERYRQLQ